MYPAYNVGFWIDHSLFLQYFRSSRDNWWSSTGTGTGSCLYALLVSSVQAEGFCTISVYSYYCGGDTHWSASYRMYCPQHQTTKVSKVLGVVHVNRVGKYVRKRVAWAYCCLLLSLLFTMNYNHWAIHFSPTKQWIIWNKFQERYTKTINIDAIMMCVYVSFGWVFIFISHHRYEIKQITIFFYMWVDWLIDYLS